MQLLANLMPEPTIDATVVIKTAFPTVPARIAMFSSTLNFGIMLFCVILVFPNRDI